MTPEHNRQRSEVIIPGQEAARNKVDAMIIEAEKFRAKVATPPGMLSNLNTGILEHNIQLSQQPDIGLEHNGVIEQQTMQREIGNGLSNDDFFHLTSHIDLLLKQKIENGEFVDLDKLLPKDRVGGANRYSDDNRMEWIQRDGGTFLVPAKRDSRITNFRKWEQAFRMYATIYCGQNSHRAKEIWQYISVINTAASAYVWENVYSYDITFRQLMAFNPSRSWAVTYNQMWNLSMREPIIRNGQKGGYGYGFPQQQNQNSGKGSKSGNSSGTPGHFKRPKYCWGFNKGLKCKFGKDCKYIERCSYCDATNHGVCACPKLYKKDKDGQSQQNHDHSPATGQ